MKEEKFVCSARSASRKTGDPRFRQNLVPELLGTERRRGGPRLEGLTKTAAVPVDASGEGAGVTAGDCDAIAAVEGDRGDFPVLGPEEPGTPPAPYNWHRLPTLMGEAYPILSSRDEISVHHR